MRKGFGQTGWYFEDVWVAEEVIKGTRKNDDLVGTKKGDIFDISQGGADKVAGGGGQDAFRLGEALDGHDRIDGGSDRDTVELNGNYGQGLAISGKMFSNIEYLDLFGEHNYNLTLAKNIFSTNPEFVVSAYDVSADHAVRIDGSLVKSGYVQLFGGQGGDGLYGGGDQDGLYGSGGADYLVGGDGSTRFRYGSASDSAPDAWDLIANFKHGDIIDLVSVDADGTAMFDQAFHLGTAAGHPGDLTVTYDPSAGGTVILGYTNADATPDLEIHLTGNHADLTAADFYL